MYEQLDLMNVKNHVKDIQREVQNDRLAEEVMKGKRNKRNRGLAAGILSVLANTLHIR